jgi:hypothetical protein
MIIPRSARLLRALMQPETVVRGFLRRVPLGSFEFRMAFDAVERPWYAHGIYEAAQLALRLGLPAISVIEFGVARGAGLVAMEELAGHIEKALNIRIKIFGFDTGEGLPTHQDYRDLPYVWRSGFYKMNVEEVCGRLRKAKLILGDVKNTAPEFLGTGGFPPIGFVSVDLDYYTSTAAALKIFEGPDDRYLPRVLVYLDDVMSADQQYFCEDIGELLAVREFNESATRHHRIRPIHGWKRSHLLSPGWTDSMRMYHRFDHGQYNTYIGKRS